MLFRELFVEAISDALKHVEYIQKGDCFYIYRCEPGFVLKFGFDVILGGSDFYIAGCARAFAEGIESYPDGQLSVTGCDMSAYASRCGLPTFSNLNIDPVKNISRRYSKTLLRQAIQRNMEIFKCRMLPDMLGVADLEDYYSFKVKMDGYGYYVPIPFPSIGAFYLCVQLGKLTEASHVYRMMLRRNDENVYAINRHMGLENRYMIVELLENAELPAGNGAKVFDRLDAEAEIIARVLEDRRDKLSAVARERIAASRAFCDDYFSM